MVFAFVAGVTGQPGIILAGGSTQLGLPPVSVPADNPQSPQKIALGKKLFEDARLSADGTISCSTCHKLDRAFTDGEVVAKGLRGQRGTRNAPTLLNVAYLTSQFWEGRRKTLEEQARDPFVNGLEHGLSSHDRVIAKIVAEKSYTRAFKAVFGVNASQIAIKHVADALASFERTLLAGNSAFDRFYYAKDQTALSPSARNGLTLFQGKARCNACHTIGAESALFTDNEFHSLGIGLNKVVPRLAEIARHVARSTPEQIDQEIARDAELAALGRFIVTRKAVDVGKFRTPSLRNVALTAPYMHDGSVNTLEEAVELEVYYRGVEAGRPLLLTVQEKSDLAAFLRSLTSKHLNVQDKKNRAAPKG